MLKGISSIVYKETIHIVRDPKTLFLVLLIPVMQLVIFGYAVNIDVRDIETVVYNLDGRRESREFLDSFAHSGYFKFVETVASDEALMDRLVRGRAKVGLKLAPDFSDRVLRAEDATVQVLIDGSDSTVAMQALNVANEIALRRSVALMASEIRSEADLPVEVRSRVLFNPNLRTPNFMVPGLLGVMMQILTMLLTAFAIVREKEAGTLEQLMVTPVSRTGLMVGKLLPYSVISVAEILCALTIVRYVFSVPIAGSLWLLSGFTLVFLFTALGMGLLISTLATTQGQALQLAVTVIMPSMVLSGFIFPQESMPYPIYWLGQLVPATYFIRILRGIILRDAGFHDLWPNAAILAAMGLLVLSISTNRFRKTAA